MSDHYKLPAIVLLKHLWELWDVLGVSILEAYSQIGGINDPGRKTMHNDVLYFIQICTTKFSGTVVQNQIRSEEEEKYVPESLLVLREYVE